MKSRDPEHCQDYKTADDHIEQT